MEDELLARLPTAALTDFIFNVSKVLLAATKQDVVFFKQTNIIPVYETFNNNSKQASLFIAKERLDTEEYSFVISSSLQDVANCYSVIVIIKEKGFLLESIPLEKQLQFLNFPLHTEGDAKSSFEIITALIDLGVAPYFDALLKKVNRESQMEDDLGSIGLTRKRINELVLSLQHIQQTVQIPDLKSKIHPKLKEVINRHGHLKESLIKFIDDSILSDAKLINELQSTVNQWIKLVQDVTQLTHDITLGTSQDEVNFWVSLEAALLNIQDQLNSQEILLTLEVLKQAKRFHATVSFLADTGIKEALATAQRYTQLLREIPLDDLFSTPDFNKLSESIILVFNQMKKLRVVQYPISRAIGFVEVLSKDVERQMRKLLTHINLMSLLNDEFDQVMEDMQTCFESFDLCVKDFTILSRELLRKRNEKFILVKVESKTVELQERVNYISLFRIKHNEWVQIVKMKSELLPELSAAYDAIAKVDVMDMTTEGQKNWTNAELQYHDSITKIQNSLTSMLKNLLSNAKNSNEMFEIFEIFQFLLVQESIRNSIQEYQSQLLSVVKSEIKDLQTQFMKQSETTLLLRLRDVPPVSATITWAKQIERRLDFLTNRCELVMGSNWRDYPEGQKVSQELTIFYSRLQTDAIFQSWVKECLQNGTRAMTDLNVFQVLKNNKNATYEMIVTFDHSVMNMFKEVRHLSILGYEIPHALIATARVLKKLYPHAVGVTESLAIWSNLLSEVDLLDEISFLLSDDISNITDQLSLLLPIKWETLAKLYDLSQLDDLDEHHLEELEEIVILNRVLALENSIQELSTKIVALNKVRSKLNQKFAELKECQYSIDKFEETILSIQLIVNDVAFNGFSSIEELILSLNKELRSILIDRCNKQLNQWRLDLDNGGNDLVSTNFLVKSEFEIIVNDLTVQIVPPLETAKELWYNGLHECVNVIAGQKLIVSLDSANADNRNPHQFNFDPLYILNVSESVDKLESKYLEVSQYYKNWSSFQSLWGLELDDVYEAISTDTNSWLQMLREFRNSRQIFDTLETSKEFGCLTISYQRAQSLINSRYDMWQTQLFGKFAEIACNSMKEFDFKVTKARKTLEELDLINVISWISTLDNLQSQVSKLDLDLKDYQTAENLFFKLRYRLPTDWVHFDQISNDFEVLKQIMAKRQQFIHNEMDNIVQGIENESERLVDSITQIKIKWSSEKPVTGDLLPEYALKVLQEFEEEIDKLESNRTSIIDSARILNAHIRNLPSLASALQEIADLKSVWLSINTLWSMLEDYKNQHWTDVSYVDLRHHLDDLLTKSRNMPAKVRQYSAFQDVQLLIKGYMGSMRTISSLKSDCMKDHHWLKIFKYLNKEEIPLDELTLGDVWGLRLSENENLISKVVTQAVGEKAVEDELNKIDTNWQSITYDFFNYKDKVRLIKKWDVLFEQCTDDLNLLTSMQHSVHYEIFEQRGAYTIERLNKLFSLLDVWIEVQRQYVYADGVFGEGNNIERLLPLEASRFKNVTAEFFLILKSIFKSPIVIDSLNVPDVQRSMERILDLLTKIKNSLAEYLEKQREIFPRFFFVGNSDLLDIIGNSHNPELVSRHFGTLFSGIFGAVCEKNTILAITSEEGEVVELSQPVAIDKTTALHSWLSELEYEVKVSLSKILDVAIADFKNLFHEDIHQKELTDFVNNYQLQITILAAQVCFTEMAEEVLKSSGLKLLRATYVKYLEVMASIVLGEITSIQRRKCENLIIEFIHQRDIITLLIEENINDPNSFLWSSVQRFYYDLQQQDYILRLSIKHAGTTFIYGFEYLGVPNRLVYTPLIDRCFLSMTQALSQKIGGSPFGPAGTGKTESIKALGQNLGRMVLVFCCDESFDFQAMGRILLGVCQVGAWACFDEFNRLDEKMLSAVSTQIEDIENSLRNQTQLSGTKVSVHPETGIFITMNPGYSGRSELPENLKKLFRSFSMDKPDREVIAEVLLNSQGFADAKSLAEKIVPFYLQLENCVTSQVHYDFGLRSLKSMLINCGVSKRRLRDLNSSSEMLIVLKSLNETVAPKLIYEDEKLYQDLQYKIFGSTGVRDDESQFLSALSESCSKLGLFSTEEFTKRATQLIQIQKTHHGIILLGDAGVGKTVIWKTTLAALGKVEGKETQYHTIDCKVMSKEEIYGSLDPVTRDWTDGLFTSILRKINENLRGELSRKIWIVFDCDVDPDWIENLNSVLDDNKTLTLPNGERISLPTNVKLLFEVDSLAHATPATVSRCGIIYVGKPLCDLLQLFEKLLFDLSNFKSEDSNMDILNMNVHNNFIEEAKGRLSHPVLTSLVKEAESRSHIMNFDVGHSLKKLQIMLATFMRKLPDEADFIVDVQKYTLKSIMVACCWAFAGDCSHSERSLFSSFICDLFQEPHTETSLVDYFISIPEAEFELYTVPTITLESQEVTRPDLIIPTTDTVKHEDLIYSVIKEHTPLIMCGPPGSGKTMTLLSALRKSPNFELVDLNFSKETNPSLLLKTMELYCEYRKTANGTKLVPRALGRWLVVFADELNLPKTDRFNTQTVISLMRQMIEKNGFYKNNQWIKLSNIQFVGACNPPSDLGRHDLSMRFLSNTMVVSVNYPNTESLYQIYETMIRAVLSSHSLLQYSNDFTRCIVTIYDQIKSTFKDEVISPRDLSRVVRGMFVYLEGSVDLYKLIRILLFNSLRVYSDKASDENVRASIWNIMKDVISGVFHNQGDNLFNLPILYTNWLSKSYDEVSEQDLRYFISERLKVFCEEETDVQIVLYDSLLDHILRIDRVLKQPQGHLILVGPSGSGKSTLVKFVSWINGFKMVQIYTSRKFTLQEFDDQLRDVIKRVTIQNEQLTFIVDESNIIEPSFLERMNNLLSSCEIPGLFGEDEMKSFVAKLGLDEAELAVHMRNQIAENLHVIFTMSEVTDQKGSQFLSSPALINRCVVDWMGDWSVSTLQQVGLSMIQPIGVDMPNYIKPDTLESIMPVLVDSYREVVVETAVWFHRATMQLQSEVKFTPSNFLFFINKFKEIFLRKEDELQSYQKHIHLGLEKLRETVIAVKILKKDLSEKSDLLEAKNKEANEVLKRMLDEQNEAERKREASIEIQLALEGQEEEIEKRRLAVMGDLALAEPAIIEALRGVKNIKKEHLNELRAMRNPPESVVLTLESVCALLGFEARSWRDVQLAIRSDTFIADIVNFDNEKMCTPAMINYMNQKYLSRPDYNLAVANRGSKACGPLLQWVEAQIEYAIILDRISPLKEEVDGLEFHTLQTKKKLKAVDGMIHDLEENIEKSKDGYSSLIRETENIKTEMSSVKLKVERSVKLLDDLTSERERWKQSVVNFQKDRIHLVGDALVSAAFLAYCGFFDQKKRSDLLKFWRTRLRALAIDFDENYAIINYLSTPSAVSIWKANGLVDDDLFVENMIVIENSERCPFIIDPSGHIVDVLSSNLLPDKLIVTSFLDSGFVKQLENALRFGRSILIQNGEYFDSILPPILSQDIRRVGSRTLVRLGDQIIDWAKGFKLYITSKDPTVRIPSYVFSRCSVVNFTVTNSSIVTQALNLTLKAENPEVEDQRITLSKLSSEYKLHLRNLEEDLLTSLSNAEGNILENDHLITIMQNLKNELREVSKKMLETEHVMNTVDGILDKYYPFALSCSTLFELLQSLQKLNKWYQFSLEYFNEIVAKVLGSNPNSSLPRIEDLVLKLYREFYDRTSLSLLYKDKVILALTLFVLYYEAKEDLSVILVVNEIRNSIRGGETRLQGVDSIAKLFGIEKLSIESLGVDDYKFIEPLVSGLLLIDEEPDSIVQSIRKSTSFLFKTGDPYGSSYNVSDIMREQRNSSLPVFLVSPDGYDPSYEVKEQNLVTIAMGSNEGAETANNEILQRTKSGGSILLQNIQMSPVWLEGLPQKLDSLSPVEDFRLVLTCSLASNIPVSLVRSSDVLVFENSPGIRVSMEESYNSVVDRLKDTTVEKSHLYFLLSWYHAVVQERLRFVPVSFTKRYDFNNTDFESGLFVIDRLIAEVAEDRTNIDPSMIPWKTIQVMIGEVIYGGKADVREDFNILRTLAQKVFVEESFSTGFTLATDLSMPEGQAVTDYLEWINKLPPVQPPHWIGLDYDVEQKIAFEEGAEVLDEVCKLIV